MAKCRNVGNLHKDRGVGNSDVRNAADEWVVKPCGKADAPRAVEHGFAAGIELRVGVVTVVIRDSDIGRPEAPYTSLFDSGIRRCSRRTSEQRRGSRSRRQGIRPRICRMSRKRAGARGRYSLEANCLMANHVSPVVVGDRGRTNKIKPGPNREAGRKALVQCCRVLECMCRKLLAADPAHTRQACNALGYADRTSGKGEWSAYRVCGHTDHACPNASAAGLVSGIGTIARGRALACDRSEGCDIDGLPAA